MSGHICAWLWNIDWGINEASSSSRTMLISSQDAGRSSSLVSRGIFERRQVQRLVKNLEMSISLVVLAPSPPTVSNKQKDCYNLPWYLNVTSFNTEIRYEIKLTFNQNRKRENKKKGFLWIEKLQLYFYSSLHAKRELLKSSIPTHTDTVWRSVPNQSETQEGTKDEMDLEEVQSACKSYEEAEADKQCCNTDQEFSYTTFISRITYFCYDLYSQ